MRGVQEKRIDLFICGKVINNYTASIAGDYNQIAPVATFNVRLLWANVEHVVSVFAH